jgi:hypothetical protein
MCVIKLLAQPATPPSLRGSPGTTGMAAFMLHVVRGARRLNPAPKVSTRASAFAALKHKR